MLLYSHKQTKQQLNWDNSFISNLRLMKDCQYCWIMGQLKFRYLKISQYRGVFRTQLNI